MSRKNRIFLQRHIVSAGILTATIAASAAAQSATACTTGDCASLNQIWVPASQVHELKNQFVGAVRQLTEALAGTYGDEGPRVSSGIDAVDQARVQWDDAIRTYEAMLARIPESAETHVALGTVYLDRNRIDDALREFAAAGRLDSRRADVHGLSALAYGAGNRSDDAVRALREASTLDGGSPITLYGLALHLTKIGRHEQARDALRSFAESLVKKTSGATGPAGSPFERVSLLRQAAGVAPIFPPHLYRSSFTLLLAGNYEQAIAGFRRAAALDPLVVDSRGIADPIAEGAAALRRGQLAPALSGLEAAVGIAPNRSEAHRILGIAYWADEQYDKSAAQLNAAIRLAPQDERSRMALADVLVEAGRPADADQALNEAIRAMPDSGQAHYRLGQLYQTLSLLPRAVHELETAATLDPVVGLDFLYEAIGGIYVNQAQFDSASDAYAKRVDVNPNNADAHRKLGEIYFLQGRHDEALAEWAAALLIDPKSSKAYAGASQLYLRTGRYAEAVAASRQALALDAGLKEARYALATSLMRLGNTEEGKKELEVFQRLQAELTASTDRQAELHAAELDAARSLASRDFAAAAQSVRKALTYEPNAPRLHRDLGYALLKAGRLDEATQALEKATQLEESAEVHQLLAEAYAAAGRPGDSASQAALSARTIEHRKEERLRKMSAGR